MFPKSSRFWALALVFSLLSLAGCKEEDPTGLPPGNTPPTIVRTQPTETYAAAWPGDQIQLAWHLVDNEIWASWSLRELRLTRLRQVDTTLQLGARFVDTTITVADTLRSRLILNDSLTDRQFYPLYTYNVPDVDTLTRIELWARVQDHRGLADSALFVINVLPYPPLDTLDKLFSMLTYTQDTLFWRKAIRDSSYFDLNGRRYARPTFPASHDLSLVDTTETFQTRLYSPNNADDPAVMLLDPAFFNYEAATAGVLHRAWLAGAPLTETPNVAPGSLVLLRMTLRHSAQPQYRHYAAIRIREVISRGDTAEAIVFDYRRTQERR